MRRAESAYPDLFPVTHVVRPGYLPGARVSLDPIRMGIVWQNAPCRTLPKENRVPKDPVRAIAFARVACDRNGLLERLIERGSSILLVLDDDSITPHDLGLSEPSPDVKITVIQPILPSPLADGFKPPKSWSAYTWGALLGLFPFPGAGTEIERRVDQLQSEGAQFAVAAPLLLTPTDRHRILDGCDGSGIEERLEDSLFHADVGRGLHALERRAGISLQAAGMDSIVADLVPQGYDTSAVRSAALLRLWARRLDQSFEENSSGWRLRRAAAALDNLTMDPRTLAEEDNLRVVPGFNPWVESFTRALWDGGEPVDSAWKRWAGLERDCPGE
ncbi:MAG: hypothetical protein GY906_28220 [bacterium]|nr:hypothetical protein [bacterium]